MAENLRNMFLKGNSEYHEAIFKIWDWIRRGRWLKQFFNLADHHLLDNQSRSCLTDRAVVCTLLESEQHPFVQQARNLVPNLTGQIVALRPAKHLYDRYAQSQAQEEETSFERCSQVLDRSRIGEEAAPNSSAQPAEDWGELTRRNAEGINALKKKGWPRSPVRRRRRRRRQSSSDEEEAGPKQNPPLLDRLRLRIQKTRNLQLRRRAEYEKDSDKSDQDELVDQVDEHDDVVCPTPVLQFSQPKKTHAATPRAENPFLMFGKYNFTSTNSAPTCSISRISQAPLPMKLNKSWSELHRTKRSGLRALRPAPCALLARRGLKAATCSSFPTNSPPPRTSAAVA